MRYMSTLIMAKIGQTCKREKIKYDFQQYVNLKFDSKILTD